uniref:Uncharacterized protein n=1 Tax=Zea mays TaxID=4577 RepID=C0HHL3_MAIZE|nr:unknown [Zea mays]
MSPRCRFVALPSGFRSSRLSGAATCLRQAGSPWRGTRSTGSRRGQRCATWTPASSPTTPCPRSSQQAPAATGPDRRRQPPRRR